MIELDQQERLGAMGLSHPVGHPKLAWRWGRHLQRLFGFDTDESKLYNAQKRAVENHFSSRMANFRKHGVLK